MIFYFSGTGNSKEIAIRLSKATNDSAQSIMNYHESFIDATDAVLGFVFPVYGWNVPSPLKDFIRRTQIKVSANTYIYAVCTCGDDIGRTDDIFIELLSTQNLKCDAFWSILMPDTYIGLPGFYLDAPNEKNHKLQLAWKRISNISEQVLKCNRNCFDANNGKFAWIKTYILGSVFHKHLTGDHLFKVSPACTHCKKCAKVCPMNNITFSEQGTPIWNHHCVDCLSCYHHCPAAAIEYGRFSKGKGQYKLDFSSE